jgi:hypothetical protein
LPSDEQLIEDMTVDGMTETRRLWGLSKIELPNSDTTYYVVDQRAAFTTRISDAIAAVGRNDSDISIHSAFPGPEFVHLSFSGETSSVLYSVFQNRLFTQLSEFFDAGGFANGGGRVEYLEYQVPVDGCPGLRTRMDNLKSGLELAVRSIGSRSETRTMVIDGASYNLHVRLGGGLRGSFGVGPNNGPIFETVRSIVLTVRECQMQLALEPILRTREF